MGVPSPDYLALLRALVDHGVDFIIVGGVSAVLHGAPVTTFDLDVVHSRTPDNLTRLLKALQDLDADYRGRGDQTLPPTVARLGSPGHQLLMTRFGPLDLLGTIGAGHDYEDLLAHTLELQVSGIPVRILDLETLIRTKVELDRDKDRAVINILRRTLDEKSKI
jgi:predicted nucleotidyltransferase